MRITRTLVLAILSFIAGQLQREEDALGRYWIAAHYRFDASRIDEGVLVAFP